MPSAMVSVASMAMVKLKASPGVPSTAMGLPFASVEACRGPSGWVQVWTMVSGLYWKTIRLGMGMSPVGAFRLTIGPDTPAYYLLIPSTSVEALATVDLRLGKDEAFVKAADAFWNAPAGAPAFARVESWLLSAFEGWPRVTPPSTTATKAKRMFQLRTYESPSMRDHVRKVEMFHSGEFEFFKSAGAELVFFGDTLVGSHAPSLTYMLSFPDTAHLEADWSVFSSDPKWTKLKADPRFGFEEIVSNISNLMLAPLGVSQL